MPIVISVPFIKGVGESNQLTIIGQCQKSLVNYVKSVNPNLKPGQAFDTGILDNVTRESVEATLVQNGNRLVRNSIDVSV